ATDPPAIVHDVRSKAARLGRPVLLDVQGVRLVVVVAGPTDVTAGGGDVLTELAGAFAAGPIVAGPTVSTLADAHRSAAEALSGLRAVVGRPAAPRPTRSVDLLPERALAGDQEAERALVEDISRPLTNAAPALLSTVEQYLESGGVLETCARALFVHPNTVRYRLRKISELTGYDATAPRDALVLRIALMVGRLAHARNGQQ